MLSHLSSLALSVPFRVHLISAFLLRTALILYGDHQDRTSILKYTDVDYRVLTDAARHVALGESPYDRHTYRYTPLLAWMLLPNVHGFPLFGKFLFAAFDIIVGMLIYSFVKNFYRHFPNADLQARLSAFTWLYNPMVFVVSTRGNAEAIIATLVLLTLHLFRERVFVLAGFAFGLAIHFKIYPIIYALSFYVALTDKKGIVSLFHINLARIRFIIGTVVSLVIFTGIGYYYYGDQFLEEAYLYHITRKDIRHNFSPYFYMLYLTVEEDDIGISLLTFVPQALLLLALAKKFGNIHDLPFCIFCQTVVFVAYNKVITSQYFLWYLALLPLSLPQLRLNKSEGLTCLVIWLFIQGSWLLSAYYLEFQGSNTFQMVWMEGLAFFTANIALLGKFIRKYREVRTSVEEKTDINKVD